MRPFPRPIFIAALAIASLAHAAPTTPDTAGNPTPSERGERGLPDKLRGADAATGSRTIDLLIDMQQRSAGLQFNQRPPVAVSGDIKVRQAPATAARAELPPTAPSGLFGSGATPAVQSTRAATVERRGGAGAESGSPRRAGATSSSEPLPRWLMLLRELIEYVRENRWLVLGSVGGGLLLIWGVSALFARAAASTGRVPGPPPSMRPDQMLSAGRWDSPRQEGRPARQRSHRRRR